MFHRELGVAHLVDLDHERDSSLGGAKGEGLAGVLVGDGVEVLEVVIGTALDHAAARSGQQGSWHRSGLQGDRMILTCTAMCRTVFETEGTSMAAPQQSRIEARVSARQKRLFERAAAIEGVTLTDFAISSMQRAATSVLQEHTRIELSERNQRTFVEALRNPPEPNEALREAARAYSKMK